jgi:hypothetical protein
LWKNSNGCHSRVAGLVAVDFTAFFIWMKEEIIKMSFWKNLVSNQHRARLKKDYHGMT